MFPRFRSGLFCFCIGLLLFRLSGFRGERFRLFRSRFFRKRCFRNFFLIFPYRQRLRAFRFFFGNCFRFFFGNDRSVRCSFWFFQYRCFFFPGKRSFFRFLGGFHESGRRCGKYLVLRFFGLFFITAKGFFCAGFDVLPQILGFLEYRCSRFPQGWFIRVSMSGPGSGNRSRGRRRWKNFAGWKMPERKR